MSHTEIGEVAATITSLLWQQEYNEPVSVNNLSYRRESDMGARKESACHFYHLTEFLGIYNYLYK